ncbi:hypothetical protein PMG71_10220 [Roseofilum sp. BLCC_M154]|uniref:Uncharacterized protein n=1 Tax=Roseofilum acuticapitatum BLCC-M154 TaxID=3022444 RepID=A0ABT7ASC2_9CYAN|nr:hypothetical protein [Roseofilum acuticapitatum]MDJ1169800.1 hypothetical protein [Roseofilum acuticapitatum BLCC-M154]
MRLINFFGWVIIGLIGCHFLILAPTSTVIIIFVLGCLHLRHLKLEEFKQKPNETREQWKRRLRLKQMREEEEEREREAEIRANQHEYEWKAREEQEKKEREWSEQMYGFGVSSKEWHDEHPIL